jgi:integrase
MANPSAPESQPKWIKTRVQHVYRHRDSGRYYVRGYRQGKEIWKALGTTSAEVARAQAPKVLGEINKVRTLSGSLLAGRSTVGEAAELYKAEVETDVTIKQSSKDYRLETIRAVFKSWEGLAEAQLSHITEPKCREWAKRFLNSKGSPGPGWKGERKGTLSASRYNNSVDSLRKILEVGVKRGILMSNPANAIGKITPRQKQLQIPSREQFVALVQDIRAAGGAVSQCSADLVEFLAYTGCRIEEARWVLWSHVDRKRGLVEIWGDPSTSTKSGVMRRIPIIPQLAGLLDELSRNPRIPRTTERRKGSFVMSVTECQKAVSRACGRVNVQRFTHHDLRHLFATRCIESGVDIPTVSRWLGHRDGGSLAMKTYGHLRDEHSQAMALKVNF